MEEQVKTEEVSEVQPTPLGELFGEPSAEPSKEEVKVKEEEVKPTEKETVEVETKPDLEAEKEATGTEEAEGEVKSTEPIAFDWEKDDNPYKKKALEFEERYKNTQTWGFKAHQKLKELGIEDAPPEPDTQIKELAFRERERASMSAAVEVHGEESVYKTYERVTMEAQHNPQLFQRLFASTTPVLEALKYAKESEFFGKYGSDIDKIPAKIRSEVEAELREKITKEIKGKLAGKEKLPNTLAGVKSKETKTDEKVTAFTPLSQIFG